MKAFIKDAATFALGAVFLITLIPPALIIVGIALAGGYLERE